MIELTQTEQDKLNKGRMMRAESGLLLPLLQTKQTLVTARIVQAFKSGHHDTLLALAAELSTLSDMRAEITRTIKQAEVLEGRMLNE